jgi:hypothetical protein
MVVDRVRCQRVVVARQDVHREFGLLEDPEQLVHQRVADQIALIGLCS